jgi:hypothetical protein
MLRPAHRYEIVFVPSRMKGIISLQETTDPNAATIAFHIEMQRLREEGATGELLLINYDATRQLMLRQPMRAAKVAPPVVRWRQHPGLAATRSLWQRAPDEPPYGSRRQI